MRDKNSKIIALMKKLSLEQNISNLVVTRGTKGSVLYNKKDKKFNYYRLLSERFAFYKKHCLFEKSE